MRLLLDTHAFLWFIIDDPQLSAKADAMITDPSNDIEVSPASYLSWNGDKCRQSSNKD